VLNKVNTISLVMGLHLFRIFLFYFLSYLSLRREVLLLGSCTAFIKSP